MMQNALVDTRHRITSVEPTSREWVSRYRPLVEEIAGRLRPRLPRLVEPEDLVQLGYLGLLEADRRYEGATAKFATYARPWVRAAMLRDIPETRVGSRRAQRILRHFEERSQALEQTLGRPPKAVECARANGLTLESYHRFLSERYLMLAGGGNAVAKLNRGLRPADADDPLQAALELSAKRSLNRTFRKLSRRERRMLKMHYEHDIKLKDIGMSFDVSESRVSQILSRALARLRAELL